MMVEPWVDPDHVHSEQLPDLRPVPDERREAFSEFEVALPHVFARAAWFTMQAVKAERYRSVTHPTQNVVEFGDDHSGDAPIALDLIAKEAVEAILSDARLPVDFSLAGEEWSGTQRFKKLVFVWDPLDGSTVSDTLGTGGCSAGGAFLRGSAGTRNLGGAISDGEITVAWTERSVLATNQEPRFERTLTDFQSVRINPGDRGRIAMVAGNVAKSTWFLGAAHRLQREMGQQGWSTPEFKRIEHLGGNPVLWPLLSLQLGGAIEPAWTKPYDSMYLYPLLQLRGVAAYSLVDGRELATRDLDAAFAAYLASNGRNAPTMEPFAVFTNQDLASVFRAVLADNVLEVQIQPPLRAS